jgi:hypothetical protein
LALQTISRSARAFYRFQTEHSWRLKQFNVLVEPSYSSSFNLSEFKSRGLSNICRALETHIKFPFTCKCEISVSDDVLEQATVWLHLHAARHHQGDMAAKEMALASSITASLSNTEAHHSHAWNTRHVAPICRADV